MQMFDPHVHMTSRTTDDYRAMAAAGIAAIVEPSFWLGQPRTHVGTFEDYFLSLVGWERFRAQQFGIAHFCTLALNPKEANNPDVAQGVIDLLPRYLEKDGVVVNRFLNMPGSAHPRLGWHTDGLRESAQQEAGHEGSRAKRPPPRIPQNGW